MSEPTSGGNQKPDPDQQPEPEQAPGDNRARPGGIRRPRAPKAATVQRPRGQAGVVRDEEPTGGRVCRIEQLL